MTEGSQGASLGASAFAHKMSPFGAIAAFSSFHVDSHRRNLEFQFADSSWLFHAKFQPLHACTSSPLFTLICRNLFF